MKRVLMIAHAGPLFGAVAGQLAEYGIETMTIEKEAITSREEAKKLAAGMGSFDGVIHSVLLDAEEYPDRLFEMEPQEWERWKETVFVQNYWILGAFLPPVEQCGGKYLVVGSAAGITPSKNDETNGAAGAAGFMMMKCAAAELGKKCRINGIAVGAMDEYETEGLRGGGMLEKHIAGGRASVKDMARTIAAALTADDTCKNGVAEAADRGYGCGYMREW